MPVDDLVGEGADGVGALEVMLEGVESLGVEEVPVEDLDGEGTGGVGALGVGVGEGVCSELGRRTDNL